LSPLGLDSSNMRGTLNRALRGVPEPELISDFCGWRRLGLGTLEGEKNGRDREHFRGGPVSKRMRDEEFRFGRCSTSHTLECSEVEQDGRRSAVGVSDRDRGESPVQDIGSRLSGSERSGSRTTGVRDQKLDIGSDERGVGFLR
jgi:hypothetical protein